VKIESKTDPNLAIAAAEYSTWTVLHYGVASLDSPYDSATVSYGDKLGQHSFPVAIESAADRDNIITRYGISIVLMGAAVQKLHG
jgi:hypothetical protein